MIQLGFMSLRGWTSSRKNSCESEFIVKQDSGIPGSQALRLRYRNIFRIGFVFHSVRREFLFILRDDFIEASGRGIILPVRMHGVA